MGSLVIKKCHWPWTATELQKRDSLTNYYGRVVITSGSASSVNMDKKFKNALEGFFNIEKDTTAVVNLAAYIRQPNGQEILVHDAPLYRLSRASNGKLEVTSYSRASSELQISPYFALNNSNSTVRLRTRISLVNSQTSGALDAVESAAKLPGMTWLLTAVSEPTVAAIASSIQAAADKYYSTSATSTQDTSLGFKSGEYSKARYMVGVDGKMNSAMAFEVSLQTRPSLITDITRLVDNRLRPDVSSSDGTRWATSIEVAPSKSVADIIDGRGVPRKLHELQAGASDEAVTRLAQVERACSDLLGALRLGENSTFRLSDHDTDLILFDELRRAGVFDAFKPEKLRCIAGMPERWKTRYDLVASRTIIRDIPPEHMETRLKKIWSSWRRQSAEDRQSELAEDMAEKLAAIAGAHDALHHAGGAGFGLARPFLETLTSAFAGSRHRISVDCDPAVQLPAAELAPIGMIVSEAVTNALKHAFPAGRDGRIWVRLA